MAKQSSYQFTPDYAVHPGEILKESLEARKIKKRDLADRCGLSVKTVSQIINGKAPIEPETAIKLEHVLGVSAVVWNNLDASYRLFMAKQATEERMQRRIAWTKRFPVKELVKRGFIEKPENNVDAVNKLLDFFAVGSLTAWDSQFKEMGILFRESPSFDSAPESVAAWLKIGDIISQSIETAPYNRDKFVSALKKIRSLTNQPPSAFDPAMKKLCADSGVALVFVSELPGTHLSGATRWLHKDKALIMLSLRHKSDDHFWFSFFHESAHILLHGKKQLFLDEHNPGNASSEDEEEANRFAANTLVPEKEYNRFLKRKRFYKDDIRSFSSDLGIAPGIIVGRLQHEKRIPFNWHNDLKIKFVLKESEENEG